MPSPKQSEKTDVPEVPPEVANRGAIALTQLAAESNGVKEVRLEGEPAPKKVNAGLAAYQAKQKAAKKAKGKAETPLPAGYKSNPEPLAGMTAAEVHAVRGKSYPDAPKMDPMLGDHTPAFKEWLKKKHPKDWEIRFYAR